MEDGVVEEKTKSKIAKDYDKAGFVKKCYARFFWKDRYILLRKNQLLVYDNEESEKCIETIELEKYDKCLALRGVLKKKPKLILVRALGNKVSDIKLQTHSAEEREEWIKALNEGINKAKNSVFDEVKIDASCALEHVTRNRAKVSQPRRPPTRYQLKGVTTSMIDHGEEKEHVTDSTDNEENHALNDVADIPQKKVIIKPPMPPSKVNAPTETDMESHMKYDTPTTDDLGKITVADGKEVCVSEDKDAEKEKSAISGSKECLSVVSPEGTGKPPTPPPKILSHQLKINEDLFDSSGEDAGSTNKTDEDLHVLVTENMEEHTEDGQNIMTKSSHPTSADTSHNPNVDAVAAEISKHDLDSEGILKNTVHKSVEDVSQDSSEKVAKFPVPPPKILKGSVSVVLPNDGNSNCEEENVGDPKVPVSENKEILLDVSMSKKNSPIPTVKVLPKKPKKPKVNINEQPNNIDKGNCDTDISNASSVENVENHSVGVSKAESSPAPVHKILPMKVKNANTLHSSENDPASDKQDDKNLNFSLNHSKENVKEIPSDHIRTIKVAPPKILKEKNTASLSKHKCSSVGDLLSESDRELKKELFMPSGLQKVEYLEKVKIKVCSELKEAEELLQINPDSSCTDAQNKHVTENEEDLQLSAKQYLNEAVEKLKQASLVLQEVKDFKELCTELSPNDAQNKKTIQSIYRRSMP
ncbi:pleckstrin homology domain-containing family O member 2 [Protopterus annectens]|uniref:pleckstrin homology domain-containing family O member 2 n=1 Tax=Protopterus annectens TaxID=7888 RepID=UPI001CFAAC23|nr:pleckstrin homology domain-containing family O member 2 [Protopterus annectens]